jgi:hypothetical protein
VHALLVLATLVASPASADFRLFEDPEEFEAAEGEEPLEAERFLDFTAYAQPGYIYRFDDDEVPVEIDDDHFWIVRARFGFKAKVNDWLRFRLEMETTPNPNLTDAYFDFDFHPAFKMRLGQFQLAFLRTFQFSERDLAFIDRVGYVPANPDRKFFRYLSPRDIGLMFTGRVGDEEYGPTFEYFVGAFLGRGPNQTRDVDSALLFALRLQLHILGVPEGVSAESDLAYNERPRVGVAAAGYTNCDDRGQFNRGLTLDAEFRWRGLFAWGSFVRFFNGPSDDFGAALGYASETGCPRQEDRAEPLEPHIAWGVSGQVQYILPDLIFPVPEQALEVLFRFDWADPSSPRGGFLGGGEGDPGYFPPDSYDNADNPPTTWRLTFGLNWFPTREQQLRLSFNYQLKREEEVVVISGMRAVGVTNDILWLQLTAGI